MHFFVLLQLSKFILISVPENALTTLFADINCDADMERKLEMECVTRCAFGFVYTGSFSHELMHIGVEAAKKIFYTYFVIRNLLWF